MIETNSNEKYCRASITLNSHLLVPPPLLVNQASVQGGGNDIQRSHWRETLLRLVVTAVLSHLTRFARTPSAFLSRLRPDLESRPIFWPRFLVSECLGAQDLQHNRNKPPPSVEDRLEKTDAVRHTILVKLFLSLYTTLRERTRSLIEGSSEISNWCKQMLVQWFECQSRNNT